MTVSLVKRYRGVSEIVSALLLLLIVSVVGFSIYMAFLSQSVAMSRAAERSVEEAKVASIAGASIVAGYVYVNETADCGQLYLYLTASARPLDVEGVYVADMPVYPNISSSLAGCSVNSEPPVIHLIPGYVNYTVLPLTSDVLNYLLSEHPQSVEVKIVTKYNSDSKPLKVVYVS